MWCSAKSIETYSPHSILKMPLSAPVNCSRFRWCAPPEAFLNLALAWLRLLCLVEWLLQGLARVAISVHGLAEETLALVLDAMNGAISSSSRGFRSTTVCPDFLLVRWCLEDFLRCYSGGDTRNLYSHIVHSGNELASGARQDHEDVHQSPVCEIRNAGSRYLRSETPVRPLSRFWVRNSAAIDWRPQ